MKRLSKSQFLFSKVPQESILQPPIFNPKTYKNCKNIIHHFLQIVEKNKKQGYMLGNKPKILNL